LPTMPSLSFSIVRHPRPPRPTLFPYTTLFRSGPCNAVLERARGADWLIHEAGNGVANAEAGGQPTDVFSFSLPHPPSVNGHSTCQEAAIVAAEAGVERLFLCHLDFGKYTEEELRRAAERNFPGEVTVPQAFKEYLLH